MGSPNLDKFWSAVKFGEEIALTGICTLTVD
jgi:hypothetical protein